MTDLRGVRCRQIERDDLPAVTDLLTRAFDRSRSFWSAGLARLAARDSPHGFPRFGFVLESDGILVGVLLTIAQAISNGSRRTVRCNLSSWYVEPAFRSHAVMLPRLALRNKAATYTDTSPVPHTWPIVESLGFVRYTSGQFVALPTLGPVQGGLRVERFAADDPGQGLPDHERTVLADHASLGCVSLVGLGQGLPCPFVFLPFRIRGGRFWFPAVQLVYCRSTEDFIRFARPLGRLFAARGRPFVVVDSAEPLPGIRGYFRRDRAAKYAKGPDTPRPNDIAYGELTIFGP